MSAAPIELIDKFSSTLRPDQIHGLTAKLDDSQRDIFHKIWCGRLDHRQHTTKHFEFFLGHCVCTTCETLPIHSSGIERLTLILERA